jgi:hypothetical protein
MIKHNVFSDEFMNFASEHYYNPKSSDIEDFKEDLLRFKYIKRLITKFLTGANLAERLILNHLIVIFNSFGIKAALLMCEASFDDEQMQIIKPFLLYLRYTKETDYSDIDMNKDVIEKLRKI